MPTYSCPITFRSRPRGDKVKSKRICFVINAADALDAGRQARDNAAAHIGKSANAWILDFRLDSVELDLHGIEEVGK